LIAAIKAGNLGSDGASALKQGTTPLAKAEQKGHTAVAAFLRANGGTL